MNQKKMRANKKRRRFCDAVHRTRASNGLTDPKVIYDTEEEAWAAVRSTTRNAVATMEEHTPYLCRPTRDHYHVGRRAKQTDNSKQDFIDALKQIPGAAKALRNI